MASPIESTWVLNAAVMASVYGPLMRLYFLPVTGVGARPAAQPAFIPPTSRSRCAGGAFAYLAV